MRIIAEFKTSFGITPTIMRMSEAYPGSLPPVSSSAHRVRDHRAFVSKKRADANRRYTRSLNDLLDAMKAYEARLRLAYSTVDRLVTDYDREEVLTATCALGIWNSASTDLDAKGSLGADSSFTYPQDVFDALVDHYSKSLPSTVQAGMSIPRGRNLGFPFFVSGAQRAANNVFLGLGASLVLGAEKQFGSSLLPGLYDFLKPYHGDPFAMEGFRQQHTGKEMPIVLTDGIFSSLNFNPRYRIINIESKLSVMAARYDIKRMLESIKGSPFHVQNRAEISDRINKAVKKGWFVISVDHSKFDFRHGGPRGKQQILLHSKILKSELYFKTSMTAFDTRFFTYAHKDVWEFKGDSMLKSGLGNTTLIGCTGNASACVFALSRARQITAHTLMSQLGSTWDALMWGDDLVLMIPTKYEWEAVKKWFLHAKLDVEAEATIKYLGSNYAQGQFQGTFDKGYSVGRAFQQQFFPERAKVYPFTTLGYIARLELMGPKGKTFHEAMLSHFAELQLGEPFKFEDRLNVITRLIPEIQKRSDKISQMDEILNLYTHGLQDVSDGSFDMPDELAELLGLTGSVDVSDPAKFLSDLSEADGSELVSKDMLKNIESIMKGDFLSYRRMLTEIMFRSKLDWAQGSVIY